MSVAQNSAANFHDHFAMPQDQEFEGGRVTAQSKALQ
jgi:hypothetical protein